MKFTLFICLLISVSFSQISNYLNDSTTNQKINCTQLIVIKPELTNENLNGQYEPGELKNNSDMIALSVASLKKNSTVISKDEIDKYQDCNSMTVLFKLKNYHKEPAILGQYEGVMTLECLIFNSIKDKDPSKVQIFSARGERHWGDSVPLANAINEICKKIKKNLSKQL